MNKEEVINEVEHLHDKYMPHMFKPEDEQVLIDVIEYIKNYSVNDLDYEANQLKIKLSELLTLCCDMDEKVAVANVSIDSYIANFLHNIKGDKDNKIPIDTKPDNKLAQLEVKLCNIEKKVDSIISSIAFVEKNLFRN